MNDPATLQRLREELQQIESEGLYKRERSITTPQRVEIETREGGRVLNFCANNYLGLADNPEVMAAARQGLDDYGFGLASVRFICGTQDLHKKLEQTIADYFGKDDAILYASCFDANGGLFQPLLDDRDAIISDQLNHASIIDGIRLCKAERHRFANSDMDQLEDILKKTQNKRTRMIATDGVFSMDGYVAKLDEITALAEKYNALVMVDDAHATGFFGPTGRGSAEHHGVMDKVDIFTSTLGKALGGGMGGFTVASQPIVDMLRQRSRPYLFSNSLAPHLVSATLKVFEMMGESSALRDKVDENTRFFRQAMTDAGFEILPGEHPIVPVMLHDAPLAQKMADELLDEGIYVIGFFYPVVPQGEARIRTQISAAHTREHLEQAVDAFTRVGKRLGVID
ncbi:MAG TPA: glycine C-acetyltransferase [Wenzhouxiangella sp.]|nr:glycine C-acetyltransferase [Wenzhouxiangella sp.]